MYKKMYVLLEALLPNNTKFISVHWKILYDLFIQSWRDTIYKV